MVDILLIFEVHQPYRLRKDFFWGKRAFRRLGKDELFDYYFDKESDREIFERASNKCYLPANQILLDLIDEHKSEKRPVKVSFSISGVFLEQCERFGKDVLESFRQLAQTGKVEILSQTYYHSLSSLYPNMDDFTEQVEKHRRAVLELLGYRPKVFENTELIYNNGIARSVEELGFEAICTEGAERVLGSKSPNELYQAKGSKELKVLLRNFRLTDDIGFRFSARWWSEWPLTAEKYVNWLASTPGRYICIFPDYETFGEHHWPETGIHDFLRALPMEMLKRENLRMATPSEVIAESKPVGMLDVPEPQTISWADLERTTGSWVGNVMQWAYFTSVRDMEKLVKESRDANFVRLWRCFQISDHLYYMYSAGGGPGAVHSYFSPYSNPVDAFITSQSIILDFEERVRIHSFAANEPFRFYKGEGEEYYTGLMVCSLMGFYDALSKVPMESIHFHLAKGDFEAWVEHSLRDTDLADKIGELRNEGLDGEKLRSKLQRIIHHNLSSRGAILKELGYI